MNCSHIDHALAIAEIYVTIRPSHWIYEPLERFEYGGKGYVLAPDVYFSHNRKVYAAEIQRTPLSEKQWRAKWNIYNMYFEESFKKAKFQEWTDKTIMPQFLCVTSQKNATGLNIPQRELIVVDSISSLV